MARSVHATGVDRPSACPDPRACGPVYAQFRLSGTPVFDSIGKTPEDLSHGEVYLRDGRGYLLAWKGHHRRRIGRLLKSRGVTVSIMKLDPYLNVDPGTMSPYQHGEVFVTDDGAETDLDLGHYERFIDENLTRARTSPRARSTRR